MIGFIITHLGRQYKIGPLDANAHIFATLARDEFILEGGGLDPFISSFQKIRDGIEFEVEVTEFDETSAPITGDNYMDIVYVDPEYQKKLDGRSEDWEWEWKLERFRRIESILKEEGLI